MPRVSYLRTVGNNLNLKMRLKYFYFILFTFTLDYCNPENESDLEKFTGRWTLNVVETQADSADIWEPRQDYDKNRKGFIVYD